MKKTPDFWVGDRIVRPSLGEIQLGLERVHLEPRSMEVLVALARRAPEVAPKQELIDEVWGEAFISDEVLTHAIWDLRRAFGDHASSPEFIQTIPKKGYRLIAPVKEIGAAGEAKTDPAPSRRSQRLLLGVLGVAVLAAVSVWIGRLKSAEPETDSVSVQPAPVERASLSGRRSRETTLVITLTPVRQTGDPAVSGERLDQLRAALAALPDGIEVRERESCSPPPGNENEYCLTPRLQKSTRGYQVSIHLKKTASSRTVYQTSEEIADLADLRTSAKNLVNLVSTYLEVVRTWDVRDQDIRPWISFLDHDVRAIRDFLIGREMVLTDEPGARFPFQSAVGFDARLVAPRVWRTPTLVREAGAEALAAHRVGLLELYDDSSGFEKAMISWAVALIDEEPSEQRRLLRVAMDHSPGNRPVRIALAAATFSFEDFDEAWHILEPLLEEKWCYPALYPLAGLCALYRNRPDDALKALGWAQDCEPVAPESYALLHLLAVYEDDTESEERYRRELEARMKEVPRDLQLDVSATSELLAARAEAEGSKEIAEHLREFAN